MYYPMRYRRAIVSDVSLPRRRPLVLCAKISGIMHFIDPMTLQVGEINSDKFWREPFRSICSKAQLVSYIVLDITPLGPTIGRVCIDRSIDDTTL
jgi:nonsense-mediated mRNA decay protein 3